jgi:hypothetical protein
MRLRSTIAAAAIFSFAGCAAQAEQARTCSLDRWHSAMHGLKSTNGGLNDADAGKRLRSAREFSETVGLIGCTESALRGELQRLDMAKYAILDASIGRLTDSDAAVRLEAVGIIHDLVLNRGVRLDPLSFKALTVGLHDESQEVRDKVSAIISLVCVNQPRLCPAKAEPQTFASR